MIEESLITLGNKSKEQKAVEFLKKLYILELKGYDASKQTLDEISKFLNVKNL